CSLNNASQGDVTLNCAGGNCTATVTAQGKTTVNCAGGGCSVACNGNGDCVINGCPTCTCTEGSIQATCTVN
ncbi:MAG: hypothetical protein KAI47_19635, partial [Deltaproteobacteria bacterium]|nr:hypothetical protein [Deltaproteobacteria bacterium]